MTSNTFDARVYPIEEPKGSTMAFASISFDDIVAIRGIRVVSGEKGLFVAMPQSQDSSGSYHDIAFPLNGDLRKGLSAVILDEFDIQFNLDPTRRGYVKPEPNSVSSRSAEEVNLNVKVFPLEQPKGETIAFASVGFDDAVAISGIRVVSGAKGLFVSMPQSKDKNGEYHDIAFPLSSDLRYAVSNAVLNEYKQLTAEKKQSIGAQLAEGKKQAAQYAVNAPGRSQVAKKSPGLGD